jgi:hypothetical protein
VFATNVVHVAPSALVKMRYPVIERPPVIEGADHAKSNRALPALTETVPGAPAIVNGVADIVLLAIEAPATFTAETRN